MCYGILPFIGITAVLDFLLLASYHEHDLNKRSIGFGPFWISSFKFLNTLNLEFEVHLHSIFVCLNGFFGYDAHFI